MRNALGKRKHLFSPHSVQCLPINYSGTFSWQTGRVQPPPPPSPGPCPNTSPFGILKIESYFFFSFGKLVCFLLSLWDHRNTLSLNIHKHKFEKPDVGMIHRNKRMPLLLTIHGSWHRRVGNLPRLFHSLYPVPPASRQLCFL